MTPAVVVTGMGVRCHNVRSLRGLWERVLSAKSGLKSDAPFDTAKFRCNLNVITDPDTARADLAADWPAIAARLPERCPRGMIFGASAAAEALTQADLTGCGDIALSIGTTSGSDFDGFSSANSDGRPYEGPLRYARPHGTLEGLAEIFGLSGPQAQISNACASSVGAIVHAIAMLRSGRARQVLAGGVDHAREADYAGFNALRAMSGTAIRAMDKDRDGMIIGDGAALLLLEFEDSARVRGAGILGRIEGFGLASDAFHATRPRPEGLAAAVRGALDMAVWDPTGPDYVNCHGTGTPANDVTEAAALRKSLGGRAMPAMSSTKTVTGHLLGTAAAIEAILTILILRNGIAPRMPHSKVKDDAIDFPVAIGRTISLPKGGRALSTTLGFGGSSACLALSGGFEGTPERTAQ